MGGASSWYAMLAIVGFLVAVWLAGRVSRLIGVSSIITEVTIGLVLGPSVLKLLPGELSECYDGRVMECDTHKWQHKIADKGYKYCDLAAYKKSDRYAPGLNWDQGFFKGETQVTLDGTMYCIDDSTCTGGRVLMEEIVDSWEIGAGRRLSGDQKGKTKYDSYSECLVESCSLDRALKCATVPDIFSLVGHTGVAMMIFESGMHFDFVQAKTVGPWACIIAILGTFLPLISGCVMAKAFGFTWEEGMAAGVSLAPTSVGIALKLLHEAKALQMYFGQAVMTAAFVDDVLSLILFSVLFALGDDMTFMTFLPLILGCLFMAVTIIGAVTVWPPFFSWFFRVIPEDKPDGKVKRHDEVMFMLMLVTLLAYAEITHECGTHLWGCFIAGMNFSTQHHAHHIWVRQVKRMTCWWLRIFFACTLAWSIPIEQLFSIEAFWKGTLMGIGPCILSKVLCAPFMGSARWAIGWAMVGRAEFAYFIAIMAKALKMMPDKLFAILLWALIYATIFAPLIFRKVLARYMASQNKMTVGEMEAAQTEGSHDSANSKDGHRRNYLGGGYQASGHLPDLWADAEERGIRESRVAVELKLEGLQVGYEAQQVEITDLTAKLAEANAKLEEANAKPAAAEVVAPVAEVEAIETASI